MRSRRLSGLAHWVFWVCRVFWSAIRMKVAISKHPTCLQPAPRPGFSIRLDDCGS